MKISIINKHTTVDNTKRGIWWTLLIGCVLECILHPEIENITGCVELVYGWLLISTFVFTREHVQRFLLATIAIFGYGFCYCVLPLIVTLIEGKPLTFNFQVPYLTFCNQAIDVTVIVAAYLVAIKIYRPINILTKLWHWSGFSKAPNDFEIWALGFIGLGCMLFNMSQQGTDVEAQATGNSSAIIIDALASFAIAPIVLLYKNLYGGQGKSGTKRLVVFYVLFIMVIGIATTRRMLIFNGILTIALIYLAYCYIQNRRVMTRRNFILLIFGVYLATGPVADLAAAMILNRQVSMTSTASDTFNQVMNLYEDKEQLHYAFQAYNAATDNGGNNALGWSEYYVDNIFLDRFCNLRVFDATLYNAQGQGFNNPKGHQYYEDFWINELPSPIANALGLKKTVHGTVTDDMVIGNFGEKMYSIQGFKVGGETGIGLYMFGYWYYLIAFFTYIVMFYFLNSYVRFDSVDKMIIPVPILVIFMRYWTIFLNANGIFSSMGYVFTRAYTNKILIYCVVFFFLRMVSKVFVGSQRR